MTPLRSVIVALVVAGILAPSAVAQDAAPVQPLPIIAKSPAAKPPAPPAPRPAANRARLGSRIGWTWVLLSSLGIAAFAVVPYLTSSLPVLAESGAGGLADHYAGQPPFVLVAFYVHIVAGGVALVASPFQFWRGLRDRAPRVHRWTGRVALVGHSFGGSLSMIMAEHDTTIRAVVSFGGATGSWDQSPPLQARLLDAVRRARAPFFFAQAENDYSLSAPTALARELARLRRPYRLETYPPVGTTAAEGHDHFVLRVAEWERDVFPFLAASMKR